MKRRGSGEIDCLLSGAPRPAGRGKPRETKQQFHQMRQRWAPAFDWICLVSRGEIASSSLPSAIGQQGFAFFSKRRPANQRQLTNSIKWNWIEWIGELFDWIKRIVVLLPLSLSFGWLCAQRLCRTNIPFQLIPLIFIPVVLAIHCWIGREEEN